MRKAVSMCPTSAAEVGTGGVVDGEPAEPVPIPRGLPGSGFSSSRYASPSCKERQHHKERHWVSKERQRKHARERH